MNLHPNAKTTPAGRWLLVQRIRKERWMAAEAAEAAGVSVRTAYKWLARYRDEGRAGLGDRRSRPRRIPRRTPDRVVRRVEKLRRRRMTSTEIASRTSLPLSTVSLLLRRLGLHRLSRLEPEQPVRRYERETPGELLHLDTKKLARIRRVGHRIHGDRSKRVYGAGWEFAHVCIDDCTRLAYVEVLPDERATTTTAFLRRALAWYRARGIEVQRVMTDNAPGYYAKRFAALCRDREIRQIFTRPYTPKTNGKAERFIQTALREWAYARAYQNSDQRGADMPRWIHQYNWHRPHASLKYKTPISRLGLTEDNLLRLHS
jgi:transposase InsO family protein